MPKQSPPDDLAISNGHGNARLHKLLAHHEQIVQALRTTLALLNGHAVSSSQLRAESTIHKAVQLEAIRTAGPKKKIGRPKKSAQQRRRETSVAFLARFDEHEARRFDGMQRSGVAALVRHGYLKAKGEGYVRTPKSYEV